MSEDQQHEETTAPMGIPDEALPEDLVPSEDNPLAEGLPPGETAEGLRDSEDDSHERDEAEGFQTGSAPQEQ